MPQPYRSRQEIIEEQRRADNDNEHFQRQVLLSQSMPMPTEADNDNEDDEAEEAFQEQQENLRIQQEQEEEEESQLRMAILQRRRLHTQEIQEKEAKAEELKEDKPSYFRYSPVFALAGFKDFLDLTFIGSLPVLGTIITFCISILIFLLLLLIKKNKALMDMKLVVKWAVVLVCGTMAEGFIFGLNFLPIELITVFIIFYIDRNFSNEQIEKALQLVDAVKGKNG